METGSPSVPAWNIDDPEALIRLKSVGDDTYVNVVSDIVHNNHLFGGQVYAQAIAAAAKTVAKRQIHSAHGYFLSAGDGSRQVDFTVERIRDGRTISSRGVVARQDGRELFRMISSWQIDTPIGPTHASRMPTVPLPEELQSIESLAQASSDPVIEVHWDRLRHFRAVQVRPCPDEMRELDPPFPTRRFWFRLNGAAHLGREVSHAPLLAYLSDYWLAGAATGAHHTKLFGRNPFMTSVDHAIWIHATVNVSDWLLYHVEAPASGYGRTSARGMIYDRAGTLIASSMQEAAMR